MNGPLIQRLVDQWRSQYNPLRGLDLRRAVALLEAGERGEYPDLQWTYRFIEKRDGILRACKRRITSAVIELNWEIKIPETVPAGKTAMAKRQQKILREAYDGVENLREALKHLAIADFRGFCHLEKVYEPVRLHGGPWRVSRLEPVPQWHWVRDGLYGDWKFIEDARQTSAKGDGQPIKPEQFIIREVDDPINEIALIAFIRKSLGLKDWDAFVESYGIPWFLLGMPEGVKPGTQEADAYLTFVQNALSDARGAIPHGAQPHLLKTDAQNQPFNDYLQRQDNEIVLAATSSLLTVLTESGSGTLAGNAHQDTFEAVARAQAMLISEILNEQFDRPLLNALFPEQEVYAYFELAADDSEDVKDVVDNVLKLHQAGFTIEEADLEERTGYHLSTLAAETAATSGTPVEESGSESPAKSNQRGSGAISNRVVRWAPKFITRLLNRETEPPIENVPSAELDGAMREEYAALYADLDRIAKLPVEERSLALVDLRRNLPDHLREILAASASVEVIEEELGKAIVTAAIESAKFGRERPITERRLS